MKPLYRLLFVLHVFVGIGAAAGGLVGIVNSQTPLGMPLGQLRNTPFNNYLMPGMILFIMGIGNLLSAYMLIAKARFRGYMSSAFSGALVIFIIVQCIMLSMVNYLHVMFFIIGLAGTGISMQMLFAQHLFPANLMLRHGENKQ